GVMADPGDVALAEIIEVRKQQAALHRRELELLVTMRRNAASRLPDDAVPGGVRRLFGEPADRWVRAAEIVAAELAPALEISPLTAMNLVHCADRAVRLFGGLLERLGDDAAFDAARLRAVDQLTSELSDPHAERVAELLARSATIGTPARWRARVQRVIGRVTGTDISQQRRRRGIADRHLSIGKIDIHGMCAVSGYLPAAEAAEADAALEFMAATADAGDRRTHDQKRADAFLTALRGPAAFRRHDVGDDVDRLEQPYVDIDAQPANVTDEEADLVAAVWAKIRELGTQVNLTIPQIPQRLVQITVPAPILAGADLVRRPEADYAAASIGRLGEIDPAYARLLARDARWRRIVVDPLSGAPLDVGTKQYRPPKRMRTRLYVRDGTCRFPGCERPAHRCELDHVIPHRPDGTGGTTADT
ncbi:HNH endonuclease signature motif containing protein, partial [Cumulibacter manganitolerans]|uniref:HNH endonuclease signature motif containing protein n=1 Tax=Cumulibacter manganitolerans TaxID=1884992 RepID=UPI001294E776